MSRQALNRLAWPGVIPRWWSRTCAWVQARVVARSKAVVSRCLSTRSSSASREDATRVQKATAPSRRARCAPAGARRTLRRAPSRPCSKRPSVDHPDRRPDAAAAAEKPSPVGLHLWSSHGSAVDHREVRGPDFGFARRAASSRRRNGADVSPIFGFNEQLGKGWMGDVGSLGRQHQLRIGRDVDLRTRLPEFDIDTRRTSASSSAETRTSAVVLSVPSRRVNSARSSLNATP